MVPLVLQMGIGMVCFISSFGLEYYARKVSLPMKDKVNEFKLRQLGKLGNQEIGNYPTKSNCTQVSTIWKEIAKMKYGGK